MIVVNDSGRPLPSAHWHNHPKVQILTTYKHERCVARNTGAAIAKGKFLHFLDDDDWLLPDAFSHLSKLSQNNSADWLYGHTQLVDRDGQAIITLEQELQGNCFTQLIAGEWIPLQSSLIKASTFFEVGGFNPNVVGGEDIELARNIALVGTLASTDSVIASVGMGEEQSSTDYDKALTRNRSAREELLNNHNAFVRMRQSAHNAYWNGRIIRAYLTSAIWNIRNRQLFTFFSRLAYSLMASIISIKYLASKDFWRAILKGYESSAFLKGFEKANRPLEKRAGSTVNI